MLVIFVLPTLLILFDGVIRKTTLHSDFTGLSLKEGIERKERKKVSQLRAGTACCAKQLERMCAGRTDRSVYEKKQHSMAVKITAYILSAAMVLGSGISASGSGSEYHTEG